MREQRNIAARAGRWSAQHRRKAILGWLAFVFASLAIGGALSIDTLSDEDSGVGESGRADKTLHDSFPQRTRESVLVQSAELKATDPAFRAGVDDTVRRLEAAQDVRDVASPYSADGQLSQDGRSALIDFAIAGDPETATDRIDPALAATAAAAKAHPELRIEQFGDASADKAIGKTFEDDFRKAELTSLPITLIVLVLAFGALVAAGVPLLLALSGVAATIGLLAPISLIAPVDESINSVILLIGLAVGVDYSLFTCAASARSERRGAASRRRWRPRLPHPAGRS